MRSFLLGRIPVYTDGAISVVDVRDVAEGHLLADRRGQPGERYILGGRNFTFDGCSPTSAGCPGSTRRCGCRRRPPAPRRACSRRPGAAGR